MNSKIVIAAYRAKPERKEELIEIMRTKREFMLECRILLAKRSDCYDFNRTILIW
jgi:hypothetical protein